MKKLTYSILLIAMAFIISVTASAAPAWSDVDTDAWYYESIVAANEKGIMEGKPGNIFAPYDKLSRAEYVTILARLSGAEQDNNNPFTDVPADSWYSGYVGWAVSAGIVKGFTDNTFRGSQKITRQELMVMTARYLDYEWLDLKGSGGNGIKFSDSDKIADFAKDSVDRMRVLEIVKGDELSRFNPLNDATRAEAATIIVRIIGLIDDFDPSPRIGNEPLSKYSLYSEILDKDDLASISDIIGDKTECDLPINDKKGSHNIIFEVDETLKMLEYKIKETSGSLYFTVSSKYAAPYFCRIVESALALRDHFVIREGYEASGTFAIDEAVNEACKITFLCETDKNPLSYSIGDKATFRVSLLADDKLVSVPQFTWQYETDDGSVKKDVVHGVSGQFVVTVDSLENPGTGHLIVKCANKKGYVISTLSSVVCDASVIYDFNEVRPFKEKPSDFNSFWDKKMALLEKTEPKAISITECPVKVNGFKIYDVEIDAINSTAYVHVSVPEKAASGSLKIRAFYDAYGDPGSDGPEYSADAICVAVNKLSIKNHQSADYYADKSMPDFSADYTADEHPFLDMIFRDIQAIRFAEKQFADLWNGRDIITTGGSMGGFQSIAVSSVYDKVTECNVNVPWMSDTAGHSLGGRLLGWMPSYNEAIKYFDSTYFATMYDGILRINAGLGDYTCPPTGIVALYNAFTCDKTITFGQCAGHGTNTSSAFNKSYSLAGMTPVIDTMDTAIKDNGYAITLPDYSDNRTLNSVEEKMKAIADAYTKTPNKIEFTRSSELNKEAFIEIIQKYLSDKHSLDKSFKIKVDDDYFGMVVSDFSNASEGATIIVNFEYTIYDDQGNYYDATALFMIKRNKLN